MGMRCENDGCRISARRHAPRVRKPTRRSGPDSSNYSATPRFGAGFGLCRSCRPPRGGEIVMPETVARLAAVDGGEVVTLDLKGKAEPVTATPDLRRELAASSSSHRQAEPAVDPEDHYVAVRRRRREQEGGDAGELGGLTEAAEWDLGDRAIPRAGGHRAHLGGGD